MTAANYSTLEGARLLAEKVQTYWEAQGIFVRVDLDQVRDHAGQAHYIVRSDMVNGAPRGANVRALAGGRK